MQALSHQIGEFVNMSQCRGADNLTGSVIALLSPIRCNGGEMNAPANQIRLMREERGWSQPDLAKLCNTSYQQISRLEKGERTITLDWAQRLGKAFGVDPLTFLPKDTLLTEEEMGWLDEFRGLTDQQRAAIRSLTNEFRKAREAGSSDG